MKKLNTIIKNEVFPFDVLVSFNETDEEFMNGFSEYDLSFDGDMILKLGEMKLNHGRTILFPSKQLVMRLNFYPEKPYEFGMLAHEIFHVVEFIFRMINVRLSKNSDECFAYMIGFYTERIFTCIQEN